MWALKKYKLCLSVNMHSSGLKVNTTGPRQIPYSDKGRVPSQLSLDVLQNESE